MPGSYAAGGALYFIHTDHLGTPLRMTDASQTLVWDEALRPFGQVEVQSTGTIAANLRFPGQALTYDALNRLSQFA